MQPSEGAPCPYRQEPCAHTPVHPTERGSAQSLPYRGTVDAGADLHVGPHEGLMALTYRFSPHRTPSHSEYDAGGSSCRRG